MRPESPYSSYVDDCVGSVILVGYRCLLLRFASEKAFVSKLGYASLGDALHGIWRWKVDAEFHAPNIAMNLPRVTAPIHAESSEVGRTCQQVHI